MSVMPLLVLCSILVAGGFLVAFIVATRRGQYDDLGTPSVRMLFDDVEDK
jgi:cbb3-type cytochrome oxidase maturation protein